MGTMVYVAIEVNKIYDGRGIEDSERKESGSRIFKLLLQVKETASIVRCASKLVCCLVFKEERGKIVRKWR